MSVGTYIWDVSHHYFTGCMDELMVFNYNMTSAQVALLYALY